LAKRSPGFEAIGLRGSNKKSLAWAKLGVGPTSVAARGS